MCPRNCYFWSHPVLGLGTLHIIGASPFLTAAEEGAEGAGAGRDPLKATLLWQSPQLLIPDIYIGSTATPH